MRKSKWTKMSMAVLAGCTIFAGCSQGKGASEPDVGITKSEPVTLVMYQVGSGIEDNEFQEIIARPVMKKYPHITVKLYRFAQGETLESLVGAQQFPDLVFAGILDVNRLKQLGLIADLNPFIRKFKYDLGQLKTATTDMVAKYGDKGEMYAMPLSLGFPIMYYNKDIFDMFAVPYPKDGMSWEDVIELAKRVTRQSDGIQYHGFDGGGFARLSLSMLQEKYDASREKALLTTPSWVRVLDYYKQWRTIPGNNVTGNVNLFAKEKRLAMFAAFNGTLAKLEDLYRQGDPLNWDMVTQPTFKEQQYVVDTPLQILMMAATSKHQEDVFRVMEVVTSKENQLHMSRNARPSVLKDIEVQNVFGQNYGSLQGKNVAAPFKYKHMPINVSTNYEAIVNKHINNAAAQVLKGVDINTALREAEEAANKEIASQAQ